LSVSLKSYDIQIFNLIECKSLEEFVSLYPKDETFNWCNGYLIMPHSIDDPTFSKELVSSSIYYCSEVWYVKHPNKDKPVKNSLNLAFHIADQTHNPFIKQIIEFIKTKESKNDT